MSLNWVRLDTTIPTNPKVLELVANKQWRAFSVYAFGLAYAGQHGTDGLLPTACLPFIHATKREAAVLVEARLWIPVVGGWEINGWAEFQPSNEETQRRKQKAKDAAAIRWAKEREKNGAPVPDAKPQAVLQAVPDS